MLKVQHVVSGLKTLQFFWTFKVVGYMCQFPYTFHNLFLCFNNICIHLPTYLWPRKTQIHANNWLK